MKNIHISPIDKPSRLWMTKLGNLTRCHDIKPIKEALGNNVNIYITSSDEEIKEGDWIFEIDNSTINIADKDYYRNEFDFKIILTTNLDLINDGIQAIDDKFLEWFVKNPSCKWIEVKREKAIGYAGDRQRTFYGKYEISIPKEEPKDVVLGYKTSIVAQMLDTRIMEKKETLEEFIESTPYYGSCTTEYKEGLEDGAKWNQERSYSEEDMQTAWDSSEQNMRFTFSSSVYKNITFEQWIKAFKNK